MTDETPRRYSDADVNRIIKRALKIEQLESITHEELLETARDLGIDPGKIEAAIKMETAAMEKEKLRESYLKRARSKFRAGLFGFIALNSGLFIIDLMTPGGWWFQWPLLGTGIALASKFKYAYFPTDLQMERAVRRHGRRKRGFHGKRHCAVW